MIRVEHESEIGMVRRAARDAAVGAGLGEENAGRAALVATEAASNLVRHAQHGAIFVRALEPLEGSGVEILSVDRGPGIADVERAMQDGYSTRSGPGQGLGAMRRMADELTVDSRPGEGTILVARIGGGAAASRVQVGGLTAALTPDGCGDAFAVEAISTGVRLFVADGLGHGPDAETAAQAALRAFRKRAEENLVDLFQTFDRELRGTRGAAVAVADLDVAAKVVHYVGIGNIVGVLIGHAGSRNMISHNGIVGHSMRRPQVFDYPVDGAATLILHTDGITQRWKPAALVDRPTLHPTVIAGRLWRSEARGRDDAGIVVLRQR
jgi:anti-sigma regulatory factor (Ser/Thr protein kinase)